jgi:adenine-specific DNA-methyltransferase
MGVPANSKQWKKGDPDFLLNFYNNAKIKDEFHSKCLYPLFYKAFNTPNRPNDVFELTGNRVPYLNGGLFENENPKTKSIDFPATYFANLLEFFGQYNFTIDENDPLDHEVGIDPEMLGHIFENLLEDNKDKGAFYTPKSIVQYMCQESLIQYLKTYLQEHEIWPLKEEVVNQTETNLQNFVRKKIAGELLNDYDQHLARALKEVKICDPSIGSGAFPMGLLNEIFHCMQVLYDASPDTVELFGKWKSGHLKL